MNLHSITSYIMNKLPEPPQSAMILGSGLGKIINGMKKTISIPYGDIPEHPCSTVSGHAGKWVFGYINSKPIIVASGRFHYYEGYSIEEVTLPVSVVHSLGCQSLIISNVAGCLKKEWEIGNFMLITGYLDYTFMKNSDQPTIMFLNRSTKQQKKIRKTAADKGILLKEGNYTWTIGPSYETHAEIQDIISIGGNAVGMSTVPEMMKAQKLELEFLGISFLTNYGAGITGVKLSHKEVLETSNKAQDFFSKLLFGII